VLRALKITFRDVLVKHGKTNHDPTGLLSLLLASIVHHSSWLLSICSKYPDHPFHSISILNEPELLKELRDEHLQLDPSDYVPVATGVPPSVKHTQSINKVLTVCANTEAKVDSFMDGLRQAVSDAVDAKVASEGGVNISILKSTLQEMKDEIFGKIESVKVNNNNASAELEQNDIPIADTVQVAGPFEFHYKGTNWPILETFQFPKETKRLQGWRMWLKGSLVVVGSQQYRIKPFSKMSGHDLHSKELKNEYKLN
jgi:hypothetical protein